MCEGWREVTLADVLEPTDFEVADEPWNFELLTVRLRARGIVDAGRRPNRTKGGRRHFIRRAGDILIGRQNFHSQCVGVVPPKLDGYVTSNAISGFRAKLGTHPAFAFLALSAPEMAAAASERMSGTGQREISRRSLLALPISLPPLADQRRIVDLIGAVDDAIEAAEAETHALEGVIARLRMVPVEAPMRPLGDLLMTIDSGLSVASSATETSGSKLLRISAVQRGLFCASEFKHVGDAQLPERARVNEGDLLMTRSNTPDRVGFVAIAEAIASDCFFPDLIWRLVPKKDEISTSYLMEVLSSEYGRSEIMARASGTSASMQKVSKGRIATIPIPLLTPDEQSEYVAPLRSARQTLLAVQAHAEALRTLRSNLLTVLLSGEHEIPETYDHLLNLDVEAAA